MFPVLIVDDAREDQILAERVLRSCKILNPITVMSSGAECLDYLQLPDAQPGLIFLDLVMAPLSGLDVLMKARDSAAGANSVFVVLSGISDFKMLREAYQLGAKTFLVKPLNTEDIIEFLAALQQSIFVHQREGGYSLEWMMPPDAVSRQSPRKTKETNPIFSVQA